MCGRRGVDTHKVGTDGNVGGGLDVLRAGVVLPADAEVLHLEDGHEVRHRPDEGGDAHDDGGDDRDASS